jgi:hypothetical protein
MNSVINSDDKEEGELSEGEVAIEVRICTLTERLSRRHRAKRRKVRLSNPREKKEELKRRDC